MKTSFFLIILFLFSQLAISQTVAEGKVSYNVTASGGDAETASMMKGATMTDYFKNGNVRVDLVFSMGTTTTLIKSGETTAVVLMDMMGQKNKMTVPLNASSTGKETYTVTETTETKVIAGYTCTKAIVKSSKGMSFTCWYTTSIKSIPSKYEMLNQIKGFPLEYEVNDNGMTLKMSATSVSVSPISDSVFAIPEGYNEIQMPTMPSH